MRIIDEVSLTDFLLTFRSNHAIWINSSNLVFLTSASNDASVLYSYTPQTDNLSVLAEIKGRALPASHTSEFVAFGNSEQCSSVCIVNLSDKALSSITASSEPSEMPNPAQEIIWNPSGDWMFITSTPIGSTRYISIADIDGDIIRNIDGRFALFQPASFGWLPDSSSS